MINQILEFFAVFGGYDGQQHLSVVERFDPRMGRSEIMAEMSERRSGASAAAHNGRIYVAGEWNEKHLDTVEMFVASFILILFIVCCLKV